MQQMKKVLLNQIICSVPKNLNQNVVAINVQPFSNLWDFPKVYILNKFNLIQIQVATRER